MRVFLGVDGGASKTVALVADETGRIVGTGRSGCSNLYEDPAPERGLASVVEASQAALAGLDPSAVHAAAFSLCGVDWPEDWDLVREVVPGRVGLADGCHLVVENDAVGALRAGSDDGTGVAVVIGTAGAIAGRDASGKTWHFGFWPDWLGASGLGRSGLRRVIRNMLGLDPPTMMTELMCASYGVADSHELTYLFTRRGGRRDEVDRLAPLVLDAAVAGDPAALAVVEAQAVGFSEAASVCARHVDLPARWPLVFAGGVLRHPASHLLTDAIARRLPAGDPRRARYEPAVGALLLALDAGGAGWEASTLDASLPPEEAFKPESSARRAG